MGKGLNKRTDGFLDLGVLDRRVGREQSKNASAKLFGRRREVWELDPDQNHLDTTDIRPSAHDHRYSEEAAPVLDCNIIKPFRGEGNRANMRSSYSYDSQGSNSVPFATVPVPTGRGLPKTAIS